MDRSIGQFSREFGGELTRSLEGASTSGFIRHDAPHWSIEPFVPIHPEPLLEYLLGRCELNERCESQLRQFAIQADSILHGLGATYLGRFARLYVSLDPDSDCRIPGSDARAEVRTGSLASAAGLDSETPFVGKAGEETRPPSAAGNSPSVSGPAVGPEPSVDLSDTDRVIELCTELLEGAGYRELDRDEIEQCAGKASQFGVPLQVDFDLFDRLLVFARGDILGNRVRRRLRRLYRRELVSVPIYQRMVVLFRIREDEPSGESLAAAALHLRMFKNIPKQDVDMLLPGTRVRITGVDRVKAIVPSLGGFLMSLRRIYYTVIAVAFFTIHWTFLVPALVVGYLIKSILSYSQTKKQYQLNLTRNLYFQKLDANAGVAYRVIQQFHRQRVVEMILAYFAVASEGEPISTRRLRRKCERIVREAVDVEVNFRVEPAIEQLEQAGLIRFDGQKWLLK